MLCRRRIRLYCDELNVLVPFCESDTDKVTTLQWTTAFLKYINKTYGDTFKEVRRGVELNRRLMKKHFGLIIPQLNHSRLETGAWRIGALLHFLWLSYRTAADFL